jgi:hypothetical protein
MKHRLHLVFVVVFLMTGCQVLQPSPSARPTPILNADRESNLQGPEIGLRYSHTAFVHCGLQWVTIDDAYWVPDEPPVGGGLGADVEMTEAPSNYDHGSLVLIDPDTAVYTSSGGTEVSLHPYLEGADVIEACF